MDFKKKIDFLGDMSPKLLLPPPSTPLGNKSQGMLSISLLPEKKFLMGGGSTPPLIENISPNKVELFLTPHLSAVFAFCCPICYLNINFFFVFLHLSL